MHRLRLILIILLVLPLMVSCAGNASAQSNQVPTVSAERVGPTITPESISSTPPENCPITAPQVPPFVPPSPYDKLGYEGEFWYGSHSLWTAVRQNGTWEALPHNPEGYTQKIFWWREGYVWTEEPEPKLVVTAERLDAEAPAVQMLNATNAYAADIGSAMLTGGGFPTLGCWKIAGRYGEAQLSFVVWIAP